MDQKFYTLIDVLFERAPHSTSSWAFVGNGVAQGDGAYDASFDSTGVSDGDYDFRVTVTSVKSTCNDGGLKCWEIHGRLQANVPSALSVLAAPGALT